MDKVLVLGSTGMAGHVITLYLESRRLFKVSNISHRHKLNERTVILDVEKSSDLISYLEGHHFDVIVNCTGILNRAAEEFKDKAVYINSYLPHFLEYRYKDSNTRIIHLSTDCVFSGDCGGYTETAFKDGDTFYDRTKAIGEVVNDKDLTFRMSIIGPDINPHGIGLFNWFMASAGRIEGYANAIWTGVTTIELAKAIETAVITPLTGLYHLVPRQSISKYDLLNIIKAVFSRDNLDVVRREDIHVNKSLINTRVDFSHNVPTYKEMIEEMKLWVDDHKELYPHYRRV